MPRSQPTPADRRRGLVAGLFGEPGGEPPELRLARSLAAALGRPDLELPTVIAAWIRDRADPGYPEELTGSLTWLADTGGPAPDFAFGPGTAAALVTLPLVLGTYRSNVNVVSGAYHVARLLDPHPIGHWSAVTVSVVTACFLRGKSDFAADLIEALRENGAPAGLVAVARRVPIAAREPADRVATNPVEMEIEILLAALFHEPNREKAERALAGRGPRIERLGGAMLGARDGVVGRTLPAELETLLDRLDTE